jgi:hypothetical protein
VWAVAAVALCWVVEGEAEPEVAGAGAMAAEVVAAAVAARVWLAATAEARVRAWAAVE